MVQKNDTLNQMCILIIIIITPAATQIICYPIVCPILFTSNLQFHQFLYF